jgi:protocatechuate 4,5-dioxygenase alpha chain
MSAPHDYDDVPGTYVFDGERNRQGYHLNLCCKSLDIPANRAAFREDPVAYLERFPSTDEQRRAVLARDWLAMLRLGGNIYYLFKLAIFDGLTMQHTGAAMSGQPMTVEEFRQMMLRGGRPMQGNRSKGEATHG